MSVELEKKLRSMRVGDLRKEISKTNVKGYSKLKKNEIVNLMLKYPKRFMYLVGQEEKKAKLEKMNILKQKPEPKKEEPSIKVAKEEPKYTKDLNKILNRYYKKLFDKIKETNDNVSEKKEREIQSKYSFEIEKLLKKNNIKDVYNESYYFNERSSESNKPSNNILRFLKENKLNEDDIPNLKKIIKYYEEEPKKEEPEKPEDKPKKEISRLDKLQGDLKVLQKELSNIPSPRAAKTGEGARQIVEMRTKLSSKIANLKFKIFNEKQKK